LIFIKLFKLLLVLLGRGALGIVVISFKAPRLLNDQLEELAKSLGVTKPEIIKEALRLYLEAMHPQSTRTKSNTRL